MQPVSGWASKLYIDPCEGEIMWFFFVSSSLCHPAVLLLMLLILGGLLFTLFIAPPPSCNPSPPHPDELKRTQPLSPSQQLGVTDFKARDMNNQTVIFSFSSSCYWPDFMILSHSRPSAISLSVVLSHVNPLFFLSISFLCPSLLLSADRWFVQEAAAGSESGGESWPGRLLLIVISRE